MAVNLFNVIQLVVEIPGKGGVRAELSFKDHFTRQKDHADRYATNAANLAYIFVSP